MKRWLADNTNPDNLAGDLDHIIDDADLFLGLSGPGLLSRSAVARMGHDPIVFALSNPDPEIHPRDAAGLVRVMATGRSDFPNQVNNALCFPGIFRGALDVRARTVNEEMKLASAHAIASLVTDRELSEEYVIPSIFNPAVAPAWPEPPRTRPSAPAWPACPAVPDATRTMRRASGPMEHW